MKITHIVNQKPAKSVLDLIEEQRKSHDVAVINIDVGQPDYDAIIDQVISSDRVISWSNVHDVA
jgi:hypothetical protein